MAILTGTTGSVTFGTNELGSSVTAALTGWTINVTREVHDVTSYADTNNAKTKIGGHYQASGTAEGFYDSSNSIDIAALSTADDVGAQLTLTLSTGVDWVVTAITSGMTATSGKNAGGNTFSFSFETSGVIDPPT